MCISPVRIRNPNLGRFVSSYLRRRVDCESSFINVPCGYCKQCIAVKQMYFVQRAIMEAQDSFLYFSTLTYDSSHLPVLSCSTGYSIPFADIHHLQLLFKRIRNHNLFGRPFRYFAVSERGSERGRPHFHILWFLPRYAGETFSDGLSLNSEIYDVVKSNWSVNRGSKRSPVYEPLFTYHQKFYRGKLFSNYDTHFVVPTLTSSGNSSVAFYACKYLFKNSPKEERLRSAFKLNMDKDEYLQSWDLVRSRSISSCSFGLGGSHNRDTIKAYIKNCISLSDRSLHYPQFFNPDTNQVFPLSPFYRSRGDLFPSSIADEFLSDSPIIDDSKDFTECLIAENEFERISNIVDKDLSIQFNFLFE